MKVKIYSNGDVSSKISSVEEFEAFQKSLRELLKDDERLDTYLGAIIENEDENAKESLETLVTIAGSLFNSDLRLLLEITDTKKVCYVENYTDRALVALSLSDVLNKYGELR